MDIHYVIVIASVWRRVSGVKVLSIAQACTVDNVYAMCGEISKGACLETDPVVMRSSPATVTPYVMHYWLISPS